MKKKTVAKPKGKQKVGKGGDFLDNPGPGGSAAGTAPDGHAAFRRALGYCHSSHMILYSNYLNQMESNGSFR